jgi:hypothetical protein
MRYEYEVHIHKSSNQNEADSHRFPPYPAGSLSHSLHHHQRSFTFPSGALLLALAFSTLLPLPCPVRNMGRPILMTSDNKCLRRSRTSGRLRVLGIAGIRALNTRMERTHVFGVFHRGNGLRSKGLYVRNVRHH